MKVLSYLILFIILVICLSMNNKKEKFFVDVNFAEATGFKINIGFT